MKSVKAIAPATVANVSCGFDIFGFAVEAPADEVILTLKKEPGVVIKTITGDGGRLPMESDRNTSGVAVEAFLKEIDSNHGVEIVCIKSFPLEVAWDPAPQVQLLLWLRSIICTTIHFPGSSCCHSLWRQNELPVDLLMPITLPLRY